MESHANGNFRDVRQRGFSEKKKVEDALKLFFEGSRINSLETEKVHFTQTSGRVLAMDVFSKRDVPHFNRSAVDGYALRAEETFGASSTNPQIFKVVDSIDIGEFKEVYVDEGEAVRVATGSPLPSGTDAVVMIEHTNKLDDDLIEVYQPLTPWKNVSRKGEDFKTGEKVLERGELIQPHHIAVFAATGNLEVEVFKKPVVSVISTGNELVEPDTEPFDGKIVDSNRYMLLSLLEDLNAEPLDMGIIPDDREALSKTFRKALKVSDMIVFSGGTSVGTKDLVPEIVNELRDGVFIHGLAIKPGMPAGITSCSKKPVILLPGFPVACYIAFNLIVPRILTRMHGIECREVYQPGCRLKAIAKRRIPSQPGLRTFTRVKVEFEKGVVFAEPIRTSGSGIISTLAKADGIVEIAEEKEGYEEGEEVEIRLISHLRR